MEAPIVSQPPPLKAVPDSAESEPPAHGLGRTVSRGVAWAGLGRIAVFLANLIVGAILAHRLHPSEFGIVALAMVFSGFLLMSSDAGLKSVVVQFREFGQEELSSLFWFAAMLGLGMAGILAILAKPIARMTGVSALGPVLLVLSPGLLITIMGTIPSGMLAREMRFRSVALCELTGAGLAGVAAVILALKGAGYWAIIAQSLLTSSLTVFLYFATAHWRPALIFKAKVLSKVVAFSGNLTAFNAANYWARNLDNFLIGKFYGAASLGFYDRAYTLMLYPLTILTSVMAPVFHSALAAVQDDLDRIYRGFLRIMALTAFLSMPVSVLLALLAPELIHVLWGPQWGPSVRLLQILCLVGAIQPIHGSTGSFLLTLKRADLVLKNGLLHIVSVCIGILIGLRWGAVGVAIGYASAYCLVVFPLVLIVVLRVLQGRMKDFWATLRQPFLVTLGTAVPVLVWNTIFRGKTPEVVHLFGGMVVGGLGYAISVRLFAKVFFIDASAVLPARLARGLRVFLGGN